MPQKKPNPIDVYVGSRVRLRRMIVGMSQEKLGEHLGLTFQQVQKYEKGTNRIGASRLFQISSILDVPVQFFFDGVVAEETSVGAENGGFSEAPTGPKIMEFVGSSEGLELNRAFQKIESGSIRKNLLDLVRTLAQESVPQDLAPDIQVPVQDTSAASFSVTSTNQVK